MHPPFPLLHDLRTQIIAVDETDTTMFAWSTKWYTTNNSNGATVEHVSLVGEYNQTDGYNFLTKYEYAEATGVVMHPTEQYIYVSGVNVIQCYMQNERRMYGCSMGGGGNSVFLLTGTNIS